MTRPAGIKNNSGDRRYLWQRGSRWWVQIRVPDDLRPRIGKKAIQIAKALQKIQARDTFDTYCDVLDKEVL